ncbi:tRNA pseudouridine(38-40) synthase TruA [Calidifontibacillus erzurumensis]|uniref:tRNA pseudouridine synthase A n=1 Tax=Calidifontibacillus erzurumensis TaxID=2741433 RepID=A0A8J8GFK0_9BACI|nr:tRNA pseudouridine(38-40) synthase TruA [Calidifontibacillus erzurumensis]NSL52559.1 tRNA pseudouridine(38-40) synthase TruA [Calidifontibacillus erzurumensis]
MKRLKCTIEYDGTNFSGFQIQPNGRTIQGDFEKVLKTIHKGMDIRIYSSGRTDAGVHARGQVIHFDSPLVIPTERWERALNALLPNDIAVKTVEEVDPDFHARFQVRKKEYRYFLLTQKTRDVFSRNYSYHFPYPLDLERMRAGAGYLTGTHDFTSFCSAKTEIEDKIRTIEEIDIIEDGQKIVFRFIGNGFLYNMVRIIVGTLLQVGQGKLEPIDIKFILEKKDRTLAGETAPPHGLYLWQVWY